MPPFNEKFRKALLSIIDKPTINKPTRKKSFDKLQEIKKQNEANKVRSKSHNHYRGKEEDKNEIKKEEVEDKKEENKIEEEKEGDENKEDEKKNNKNQNKRFPFLMFASYVLKEDPDALLKKLKIEIDITDIEGTYYYFSESGKKAIINELLKSQKSKSGSKKKGSIYSFKTQSNIEFYLLKDCEKDTQNGKKWLVAEIKSDINSDIGAISKAVDEKCKEIKLRCSKYYNFDIDKFKLNQLGKILLESIFEKDDINKISIPSYFVVRLIEQYNKVVDEVVNLSNNQYSIGTVKSKIDAIDKIWDTHKNLEKIKKNKLNKNEIKKLKDEIRDAMMLKANEDKYIISNEKKEFWHYVGNKKFQGHSNYFLKNTSGNLGKTGHFIGALGVNDNEELSHDVDCKISKGLVGLEKYFTLDAEVMSGSKCKKYYGKLRIVFIYRFDSNEMKCYITKHYDRYILIKKIELSDFKKN